jgi:hypothetical protein
MFEEQLPSHKGTLFYTLLGRQQHRQLQIDTTKVKAFAQYWM